MKLNKLHKSIHHADNVRSLLTESKNELRRALIDFARLNQDQKWALIGGLALGFHGRPRGTQDIDVILNSDQNITKLNLGGLFKRNRDHSIEHTPTGIEIELITPEFIKIPPGIITQAINDAIVESDIKIVDADGLIALKLQRASHRDLGDIEDIISIKGEINLNKYHLTDDQIKLYQSIIENPKHKKPTE